MLSAEKAAQERDDDASIVALTELVDFASTDRMACVTAGVLPKLSGMREA
jgi:hypothetical protein